MNLTRGVIQTGQVANSINFNAPFSVADANFDELDLRVIGNTNAILDLQDDIEVINGQLSGISGLDTRVSALETAMGVVNGAIECLQAFRGINLFRLESRTTNSFAILAGSKGVSRDGRLYSIPEETLIYDDSPGAWIQPISALGWRYIWYGVVDETECVRLTTAYGVPDGMANPLLIGVLCVPISGALNPFTCAYGDYKGGFYSTSAPLTAVIGNNDGYNGDFGFPYGLGFSLRYLVSSANRFSSTAGLYIDMPSTGAPAWTGNETWSTTAPGVFMVGETDSSCIVRLFNRTGASRTVYIWPIGLRIPFFCQDMEV